MTQTTAVAQPDPRLTGACICGSVRFALDASPIITHCCHCRLCQKVSGSAFCINSMIETEHVTVLQGSPEAGAATASHKVVQCPSCKAALWSYHPELGEGIAFVRVGVLDHGERLTPEAHYFTRSKHPWVALPAHLPAFAELGDPGKPSAGARIEAVLAAAASQRQAAPE